MNILHYSSALHVSYEITTYIINYLNDDLISSMIRHKDHLGFTPVGSLCAIGSLELFTKFINNNSLNLVFDSGGESGESPNPFMKACAKGHLRLIKHIVETSPVINSVINRQDCYGRSAMYFAACNPCALRLIELLVEHGSDGLCTTKDGMTPLHMSAEVGDSETVKWLAVKFPEALMMKAQNDMTPIDLIDESLYQEIIEMVNQGKIGLNREALKRYSEDSDTTIHE
eukprot:GHVH01002257.1.p1 GENE.GHVH01002257.1~~GHVH01002257.1.p1  ORF type:complete len:228 (+),score=29.18 GHVH01002257.1:461-1144(+)